jgi:hypothetical protein
MHSRGRHGNGLRLVAGAAEQEHARPETDGCEQPDDRENLDLRTDGQVHVSLPEALGVN